MSRLRAEAEGVNRQHLYKLIDGLPEHTLWTAQRFLEFLSRDDDPVERAFDEAPLEDEILTEEELALLREGREDVAAGRLIPHAEAMKMLGL